MPDKHVSVPSTNAGLNTSTILRPPQEQFLCRWSRSDREKFGKLWISNRQQKRLVKEIRVEVFAMGKNEGR